MGRLPPGTIHRAVTSEKKPGVIHPDDLLVRLRETWRNANVGKVADAVLKAGPRTWKFAALLEIIDSNSKQRHHYELRIQTLTTRGGVVAGDDKRAVSLVTAPGDEVGKLVRFIRSVIEGDLPEGDFHVLPDADFQKLDGVRKALGGISTPERAKVVAALLGDLADHGAGIEDLRAALSQSGVALVREAAAAARAAEYREACVEFDRLVETPGTSEGDFQRLLTKNPWMFGSEYSELLDTRRWTRDHVQDFMLRRTVDGFLEIIEIKTPFNEPLFRREGSQKHLIPSSKLTPALGQVMTYIDEIERDRDSINSRDGEDPFKIRARIVIGRDGDADQLLALRRLNSHLHRIEVVTFDQFRRIAARVLELFSASSPRASDGDAADDVPF
jgi:hypothetical protein